VDQLDQERFREFVTARKDSLRSLAYVTCGDWHAADDAVANVLAKLYSRWSKVERVDAYARTMVVRAAIDEKRRPWRRERSGSGALPETTLCDPTNAADERLRMRAAMLTLAPRQRAVLVLRFYENLSTAETAQALNCSEGTVKSQCSRGLSKLREVLRSEHIHLDDMGDPDTNNTGGWESASAQRNRDHGVSGTAVTVQH
jgi:RNA polymerase sigma-70 factor (sigma-E family)